MCSKENMYKIFFLITVVMLFYIYMYISKENFDNQTTVPQITQQLLPISNQLTNEIARVLKISPRRIQNLSYTGDITSNQLKVSFVILDANLNEYAKKEINNIDAGKNANSLFETGNFVVTINNKNVLLSKINTTPTINDSFVFDNKGLLDISKYSQNAYISVPNDSSLTKFYKLEIDKNLNIVPRLPITT
jgi:hypothetical protein